MHGWTNPRAELGQDFLRKGRKGAEFRCSFVAFTLVYVMHGKTGLFIDFESELIENNWFLFDKTRDKMLFLPRG